MKTLKEGYYIYQPDEINKFLIQLERGTDERSHILSIRDGGNGNSVGQIYNNEMHLKVLGHWFTIPLNLSHFCSLKQHFSKDYKVN
jgi:hypothetical protein